MPTKTCRELKSKMVFFALQVAVKQEKEDFDDTESALTPKATRLVSPSRIKTESVSTESTSSRSSSTSLRRPKRSSEMAKELGRNTINHEKRVIASVPPKQVEKSRHDRFNEIIATAEQKSRDIRVMSKSMSTDSGCIVDQILQDLDDVEQDDDGLLVKTNVTTMKKKIMKPNNPKSFGAEDVNHSKQELCTKTVPDHLSNNAVEETNKKPNDNDTIGETLTKISGQGETTGSKLVKRKRGRPRKNEGKMVRAPEKKAMEKYEQNKQELCTKAILNHLKNKTVEKRKEKSYEQD